MKRKKIYTAIAGTLLLLLYIVIFCFSAEDGESSSALSTRVTLALYRLYYGFPGYEGSGQVVADAAVLPLEGFIRKLGHFLEYFCMGFLSCGIAFMWMKSRLKGYMMIVAQLFLSAGADELHQYFVPGRHASFRDVLLDVSGGITGMLLLLGLAGIRRIHKEKKKEKSFSIF